MKNHIHQYSILFILLVWASSSWAATYHVSNLGDDSRSASAAQNMATPWLTIGHAIAQASANDEIVVAPGTYEESILINKSITLTGTGKPLLIGSVADQAIIRIAATNVIVQGFKMEVNQADVIYGIQAVVPNVSGLLVQNNEILGSAFSGTPNCVQFHTMGILLENIGSSEFTIRRNVIFVKTLSSCVFGRGVRTVGGHGTIGGPLVTDSNLIAASRPLQIGEPTGGSLTIQNNHTYGRGVELVDPKATTGAHQILNNRFDGGRPNVTLTLVELRGITETGTAVNVSGNVFANFAYYGLLSSRANNVTIQDNVFTPYDTTTYICIGINTKQLTAAPTASQTAFTNGAVIMGNTFNPPVTPQNGGAAVILYNHNNVAGPASFGAVTVGTSASPNTFNKGIKFYVVLDTNTGPSKLFKYFESEAPTSITLMSQVNVNLDITNNLYGVSSGLKRTCSMSMAEQNELQSALMHQLDKPGLGLLSFTTTTPPVISGASTICSGGSTVLTTAYVLQSGESYLWSDNSTGSTLTVSTVGSYSLQIANPTTGCTTAISNVITVSIVNPAAPTISGTATYCPGANTLLSTSYMLGTDESYLWSDNSSAATLLVSTPGAYSLRIKNDASGCISDASNTINVSEAPCPNTRVWTGNTSTAWFETSNWLPAGLPLTTDSVIIPIGRSQYPVVSGGRAEAKGLTIQANTGVTISPSDSLAVRGVLSLGTGIQGGGSLIMRGTVPQIFSGSGIGKLVIDNLVGVKLSSNLSVTGGIRVLHGTLDMDNRNVTLVSNSTTTAGLGSAAPGSLLNASNITTQRWFNPTTIPGPPRYGTWNYVTAPTTGLTVNYWSLNNPYAVYTYVGAQPANSSVWLYDPFSVTRIENNGYVKPTGPSQSAGRGVGLRIFFRTTPFYSSGGMVQVTGAPFLGEHTWSLQYCASGCAYPVSQGGRSFNGFNLIGNPYMGPIDWDDASWERINVAGSTWIWRDNQQNFATYLTGVGGVNGGTNLISHHQAFFVEATNAVASLKVKPAAVASASTSPTPSFYRGQATSFIRFTLSQDGFVDENLLVQNPAASRTYHRDEDAGKMGNPYVNMSMLTPDAERQRLVISSYPLSVVDTIPLFMQASGTGAVYFTLTAMQLVDKDIWLLDQTTSTMTLLAQGQPISLNADGLTNRYALVVKNTVTALGGSVRQQLQLYPNPASGLVRLNLNEAKFITVINQLGQQVLSTNATLLDVSTLAKGMYWVHVPGYASTKLVVE